MTDLTYETAYYTNNNDLHLLPSILVPQTSYPLISMCRSNPTNRLPNWSFVIALKRKLRLPIFDPTTTPNCPCGIQHDIWGDHIFRCVKHNKIAPHNFIRDNWASALQPALALAGYITPSSQLQIEKDNLNISDTHARPFDISFDPDPSPTTNNLCHCPFSTVGADITITHSVSPSSLPLTADVQHKLTAIADKHLQQSEKGKYMRNNKDINPHTPSCRTIQGESIIRDLINSNTILLPFVLDPHGRWGPIMQNFLTTSTSTTQLQFPPSRPHANTMYHRSTSHPAPTAILLAADSYWKAHKTRRYFGFSHSAPTPQIHTIQSLGLGITKAFSLHIRNSIHRSTSHRTTTHPNSQHSHDSDDSDTQLFSPNGT